METNKIDGTGHLENEADISRCLDSDELAWFSSWITVCLVAMEGKAIQKAGDNKLRNMRERGQITASKKERDVGGWMEWGETGRD